MENAFKRINTSSPQATASPASRIPPKKMIGDHNLDATALNETQYKTNDTLTDNMDISVETVDKTLDLFTKVPGGLPVLWSPILDKNTENESIDDARDVTLLEKSGETEKLEPAKYSNSMISFIEIEKAIAEEELTDREATITKKEEEIIALKSQVEDLEKELKSEKEQNSRFCAEYDQLEKAHMEQAAELRQLKSERELSSYENAVKIKEEENSSVLKAQIEALGKQLEEKCGEISSLRVDYERVEEITREQAAQLEQLEQLKLMEEENSGLKAQIDALGKQLEEKCGEISSLRVDYERVKETTREQAAQMEQLELEENSVLKAQIEALDKQLEEKCGEISSLRVDYERVEEITREQAAQLEQLKLMEEEIPALTQALREAEQSLKRVEELSNEAQTYKTRCQSMEKEIPTLNQALKEAEQSLKRVEELSNEAQTYKTRCQSMEIEIERLNGLCDEFDDIEAGYQRTIRELQQGLGLIKPLKPNDAPGLLSVIKEGTRALTPFSDDGKENQKTNLLTGESKFESPQPLNVSETTMPIEGFGSAPFTPSSNVTGMHANDTRLKTPTRSAKNNEAATPGRDTTRGCAQQ